MKKTRFTVWGAILGLAFAVCMIVYAVAVSPARQGMVELMVEAMIMFCAICGLTGFLLGSFRNHRE